jgi:hypothetical protein
MNKPQIWICKYKSIDLFQIMINKSNLVNLYKKVQFIKILYGATFHSINFYMLLSGFQKQATGMHCDVCHAAHILLMTSLCSVDIKALVTKNII